MRGLERTCLLASQYWWNRRVQDGTNAKAVPRKQGLEAITTDMLSTIAM